MKFIKKFFFACFIFFAGSLFFNLHQANKLENYLKEFFIKNGFEVKPFIVKGYTYFTYKIPGLSLKNHFLSAKIENLSVSIFPSYSKFSAKNFSLFKNNKTALFNFKEPKIKIYSKEEKILISSRSLLYKENNQQQFSIKKFKAQAGKENYLKFDLKNIDIQNEKFADQITSELKTDKEISLKRIFHNDTFILKNLFQELQEQKTEVTSFLEMKKDHAHHKYEGKFLIKDFYFDGNVKVHFKNSPKIKEKFKKLFPFSSFKKENSFDTLMISIINRKLHVNDRAYVNLPELNWEKIQQSFKRFSIPHKTDEESP